MYKILANENNYRKGRIEKIKYIVIHYTGNAGSTAKENCLYFKNSIVGASAHYFVDSENVIQSVEDCDIAWHCGTKYKYIHPNCRNSNSLGIEICCNKTDLSSEDANDIDWFFEEEAIKRTLDLTSNLIIKYNIDIDRVLRHFDITGKICPAPFVNDFEKWEDFKAKLEKMKNEKIKKNEEEIPLYAKEAIDFFIIKGYLKGNQGKYNLNNEMIRLLVILYRTLIGEGVIK